MRIILLTLLFFTLLLSRDNPFKPTSTNDQISNNNQESFELFKDEQIFLPSSSRVIKTIEITYQNVDGSLGKIKKEYNKEIDWHKPIEIKHSITKIASSNKKNGFIDIPLKNEMLELSYMTRDLRIETPFKISKHFFLSNPYRVVIDFQGLMDETNKVEIKDAYFKSITVSNHDNFFRITAELDSFYKYLLTEIDDGYILGIR